MAYSERQHGDDVASLQQQMTDGITALNLRQQATATSISDGTATWTFLRPFTTAPIISFIAYDDGGLPVTWRIVSKDNTMVKVKAYRAQTLPTTLTLLTALQGFNVFGGTTGAGLKVDLYAAAVST